MKTLIWDLDGTLIDSYPIIVEGIQEALRKYSLEYTNEEIYDYVITYTVGDFLSKVSNDLNVDIEIIKKIYSDYVTSKEDQFKSIPYAKETLATLSENNIKNYVYTHKGKTTEQSLINTELLEYFEEIVTSENDFKRKPDPEALNYLINKYNLDKKNTYYVGDRIIDVDCAINANIKSIYYGSRENVSKKANFTVESLKDIVQIIIK